MLALAASVFLVAAIALLGWLHVAQPSLSPLHDAVSLYGATASAGLFRLYVHLGTAGIGLFVLQLHLQQHAALTHIVAISLLVLLAARLALPFVPTDAKGRSPSSQGRSHLVLAVIVFASAYTAADNATPAFVEQPLFLLLAFLRWLCAGCLAAVVATMLLPRKHYFGLAERGFLLFTLLWFLVASLSLRGAASAA